MSVKVGGVALDVEIGGAFRRALTNLPAEVLGQAADLTAVPTEATIILGTAAPAQKLPFPAPSQARLARRLPGPLQTATTVVTREGAGRSPALWRSYPGAPCPRPVGIVTLAPPGRKVAHQIG